MTTVLDKKKVISWALYDWANSAYATVVMAGFFPIFFKQYWASGLTVSESTFQLGLANSIASLVIVFVAPLLGAIADSGGARKKFLLYFAAMGIVMTGGLYFVAQGQWAIAVTIYIIANIGFMGGNIFYDALLVNVAPEKKLDAVSALGYALGYLGGGLLFSVCVAMTLWPQTFGLADGAQAVRVSFVCVALWWALFSLPVFIFVKDITPQQTVSVLQSIRGGLVQLLDTFRAIRRLRVVAHFLLAYWLYIDAVDTIVRMAVDYGMSLGFDSNNLIAALLLTQFVGFPAALAFGRLGERFGAKAGILVALAIYMVITLWAASIDQVAEFYMLAIMIGLVQGGVQSLSRSFYARLIPAGKAAEFFGFYNLMGKFAAVIGPVMMGWVSLATGNPRASVLSLLVLFVIGAAILYFVDEKEGQRIRDQL